MRLIDADALFKAFDIVAWWYNNADRDEIAVEILRKMPTIDAVPVVRCKDCIHHEDEEPGMVYCPVVIGGWVNNDFFCGDGERREE